MCQRLLPGQHAGRRGALSMRPGQATLTGHAEADERPGEAVVLVGVGDQPSQPMAHQEGWQLHGSGQPPGAPQPQGCGGH
jgi:hypothetical protein